MNELNKKVNTAIQVLKSFEPKEGYCLCYSGGKDSDTIRILAALSGVKHDIIHNNTTVDAPETMQYIKSIPDVIINNARWQDGTHKTMWNLIIHKKVPPTRLMRYCCSELKETTIKGRLKITGVRAAESVNRTRNAGEIKILSRPKTNEKYLIENEIDYNLTKQKGIVLNFDNVGSHRAVEHCYRTSNTLINPILNWNDNDVWAFLKYYNNGECNPLYNEGCSRIGCIGCPMTGKHRIEVFKRYPKYYEQYIRTFDKMLLNCKDEKRYNSGEEVMNWWLSK